MIYLIYNLFKQHNSIRYELRNANLEEVSCNLSMSHFTIGDFVVVENDDFKKMTKVDKPDNFLDFFPTSKKNKFELKEELLSYINKIKNKNYRLLLDKLIINNDLFFIFPAAKKIHHAFIGGLCEHTLNLLFLADAYIEKYQLDRDLLYTGIIFHDFGKLIEYDDYGLRYSLEGNLLGHISIVNEIIAHEAMLAGINHELDIIMLKHLVLSHHGLLEYGSPKQPMCKEAIILHVLDDTDAKMDMINQSFKDVNPNHFGAPIQVLDRQKFFNYEGEK